MWQILSRPSTASDTLPKSKKKLKEEEKAKKKDHIPTLDINKYSNVEDNPAH